MLNRSNKILGRPYLRLTYTGSVNPFLNTDALRNKLIATLKSSPHFVMVGEPDRAVSSAFVSSTSLGFGTVAFDATIRYFASADGLSYDTTLRPVDCGARESFGLGSCLLKLSDAGIIGDTFSTNAPVGMKTAQQLATETKSPIEKVVTAASKPLEEVNSTIGYVAFAVIAVAAVMLAKQGKPLFSGIGKAFRRARK